MISLAADRWGTQWRIIGVTHELFAEREVKAETDKVRHSAKFP